MNHWMFNCKEVTKIISASLDRKLPLHQRIGVRIHLLMCKFCARYKKQIYSLRSILSHTDPTEPHANLSSAAKDRIKQIVHDHMEK